MSGDKTAAASGEATLERQDNVALAKLVRARAQEPTIRVGQDDLLKPEETSGGCDAMKVEEMRGNYKINPDLIGRVRREGVTHQDEKSGWRLATLGEFVANRTRGIVPNKTPDTTFELFSVPSLDTGAPEIIRGKEIGSNKQIVDEGTVLLCKINPRINRSWVVSSHTAHRKIASTEWITFPPNEAFEPKYLSYYLKKDSVRDFLAANASGVGGSLMRVKPTTLRDYPFPLAPLDQQKRIVAEIEKQFSRLDKAVANLKHVKANLKRYKAAVLKAAVEGRLVEVMSEAIVPTPLGSLGDWCGGGTPSKSTPEYWTDGEIPWVSPKDMKTEVISDAEDHITEAAIKGSATNLLSKGSVLVVTRSGILKHTLPVAVTTEPVAINQDLKALQPTKEYDPQYIALAFRAQQQEILHQCGKEGTTVQSIEFPQFLRYEIPVPTLVDQRLIVTEVERRLSLVRGTEAQVDANLMRADRLRQAVLRRSFRE